MTKLISALAFVLLLCSCGFSPMYGSNAGSTGINAPQGLAQVDITLIPDESGVYLRNILIDHFYHDGYPTNPAYTLKIEKIDETKTDLDITIDSEATRQKLRLTTTLNLTDTKTGTVVMTRKLSAITSYNVLGSQFTTRVSENDARQAALEDLARQAENQVALFFKR